MSHGSPGTAYQLLQQRLQLIQWQLNPARFRSHAALLKEFLRRSSLWAGRLGCGPQVSPLVDWVAVISDVKHPSVEADFNQRPPLPEAPYLLEMRGLAEPPDVVMVRMVRFALRWAAAEGWAPIQHVGGELPNPYEPLIRLLERGGPFSADGGFLRVGPVGVVLRTWRLRADDDGIALDDDSLDRIDENRPDLPTYL